MKAGIKVSVNSDDPPMFGTDMNNEFIQLHNHMGFTLEQLYNIGLDSIETSFVTDDEKKRLTKVFEHEYGKLV